MKNKKISLLRYWTTSYLVTLFIGLIVIAIISALWIRYTTLENRLNVTKFLAQEIADRYSYGNEGKEMHRRGVPGILEDRQRFLNPESKPSIYILDESGRILASNLPNPHYRKTPFPPSILENDEEIQKIQLEGRGAPVVYAVKTPIVQNEMTRGWVVILQTGEELTKVNQEYRLLAVMLISLGLLGWLVIYFLTKKVSQPIQLVAAAANQIQDGDYNITLKEERKILEVDELVHSFKNMAVRLKQLESLRTELLAGVTHELKTPITSISGLLQAVKEEVVTGEDAKEFIDISLKETKRMQKMVEDLLDFNAFAANAVPVFKEERKLNDLVKEICYQWGLPHENDIAFQLDLPDQEYVVEIDAMRLQQILVNLFNNAMQAMDGKGTIHVKLLPKDSDHISIEIRDFGKGIPPHEQPFIFERFFRGENKKYTVRGLGLGLSFSKMMAQAMGGDLLLKESSEKGTTFELIFPYK